MVLQVAYTLVSSILPSGYYLHIGITAVALLVIYAFAQGRTTNRERDLHARVIIVTGAFSPMGLTLLSALAARGAQIIAISSYPLDHAFPSLLIPLLRTATNNENIFAEHADLSDPTSIREFCTRFLTGQDQRLDAIVFGHEYHGIGSLFSRWNASEAVERRDMASLATFLMITLLLPALLVEPAERDIRIVNVVNPFYAASASVSSSRLISNTSTSRGPSSVFLQEGIRALRTTILTRHLQRVLDSLPNRVQSTREPITPGSPSSSSTTEDIPSTREHSKSNDHFHPSNIIAVSVCPGISRKDIIAPLLGAERDSEEGWSVLGFIIYTLLFPFFVLLTKSTTSALQSVLHVIFLPTPLKRALAQVDQAANPVASSATSQSQDADKPPQGRVIVEEVLKPGALYRECAVVQITVPPLPAPPASSPSEAEEENRKGKKKGSGKQDAAQAEGVQFPDDGEYGGEAVGRAVWEWYEENLKRWEAHAKEKDETKDGGSAGDKSTYEGESVKDK